MTSAEVITELSKRGVVLEARGDRLGYVPKAAVDDDLLVEMKRHKADLLRWAMFADCFKRHWGSFQASALVN